MILKPRILETREYQGKKYPVAKIRVQGVEFKPYRNVMDEGSTVFARDSLVDFEHKQSLSLDKVSITFHVGSESSMSIENEKLEWQRKDVYPFPSFVFCETYWSRIYVRNMDDLINLLRKMRKSLPRILGYGISFREYALREMRTSITQWEIPHFHFTGNRKILTLRDYVNQWPEMDIDEIARQVYIGEIAAKVAETESA